MSNEPNKNQQDTWFIERMETYYKDATGGDWTADGDGISSDKLEDEQVASNMYDRDADFVEFAQNTMPRMIELAKEALTLRAALKEQLEYRIQDSEGIKEDADWLNDDAAQDTTIAACEDKLKQFNLGDE